MMFAMATAPLGQPHQSLRSILLAGNTEGTEGDSRRYLRKTPRCRDFYNEPVTAAGSESCEGKGNTTCSRNGMKAVRSRTSSWNLSKVLL